MTSGTTLRRGRANSCGCLRSEHPAWQGGVNALDLLGQEFGRLTVVAKARRNNRTAWKCICACGNTAVVATDHLRLGNTRSCGCAVGTVIRDPSVRDRYGAQTSPYRHKRRARLRNCEGSFTKAEIDALYKRQRGKCAEPLCRILLKGKFHRDHVMPLALGGSNAISNIQLMCGRCNNRKHAKHPITWAQQNGRLL